MSRPISQRERRTYFNNALIEESLRYLPAALDHPSSIEFRRYLVENLHHNSLNTRRRFAEYISQRFSHDGVMNRDLALAIRNFGDSRSGREILYFELLRSVPLLQEIASLWLAELPEGGKPRAHLIAFLETRLGEKRTDNVAQAAVQTFRECRKLTSPKPGFYVPVWSEPPLDAFLYVLVQLYPERTMVRVDLFTNQPLLRAMLWPGSAIEQLLAEAQAAGHVSKISQLDQYHQFTLAGSGNERMRLLVQSNPEVSEEAASYQRHPKAQRRKDNGTSGKSGSVKRLSQEDTKQLPLLLSRR